MRNFFCALMLLFSLTSQAQLNFKISYDGAYFKADKINAITRDFNANTTLADKNFRRINYLNGISLGVRYRWDFFSLEGDWFSHFNSRLQSTWTDANKTDKKNQTFGVALQKFSIGPTFHVKNFGFGATIDRSYFNMNKKFIGQSKRSKVFDDDFKYNSITAFIQYEGEMNRILHFSLRPYIQLPMANVVNVLSFQQQISPNSTLNLPEGYTQAMTLIGFRIIFYNGRQDEN